MDPVHSLADAAASASAAVMRDQASSLVVNHVPHPAPAPAPASAPSPMLALNLVSCPAPLHSQAHAYTQTQAQARQAQTSQAPLDLAATAPTPPALSSTPIPRPDDARTRQSLFSPLPAPAHLHMTHQASSPPSKDTNSSISTQATTATLASAETSNTSYSADTSPSLHQSIFSIKDGSDVSNTRRTSRRRTGPLSQQSRERAALIRKLGACTDCRRRRVAVRHLRWVAALCAMTLVLVFCDAYMDADLFAPCRCPAWQCQPIHHNLTWEDLVNKFQRSHSPGIQDIAPSLAVDGAVSPTASLVQAHPAFVHDAQDMDIDSAPSAHQGQPGRPPLSEARVRTPLPSGPRLEKSLSLPGIESLKNEIQATAPRVLSTSNRGRYNAANALLLFWQDDDDVATVQYAVQELAEVLERFYHYAVQIHTIPSSSGACRSSWRWLSRKLNEFAEDSDQRDMLKIVYYAGHTYLDGNRDMTIASSKDGHKASTIRWAGIQQILEEACADTLIIMDAAYYPSSKIVRQRGVLELIAASASEHHVAALDHCAFTRALADQLRMRASRSNPLSAAELHSILLATYPKMLHDRNPEKEMLTSFPAPLHAMVSGHSRLPSIFISPVNQRSPLRNSFSYENSPQLHLSIKLQDDNVDVETWNEWLRLMPEGVKDVKVDGPFRSSFR
ncbi:hypothetical protein CDD81_1961 [Ophiocordyceps australis]|uniref:Uncharacterized protein n=1 Tax=Ophiocordyceps australis TaxID=1399860 RepID=A0A2C5XZY0_9HYPO|nr:hypothetical protein CDD81_1961 [Ophiocordyceps australis]